MNIKTSVIIAGMLCHGFRLTRWLCVIAGVWTLQVSSGLAQGGGPPRRLDDPQTMSLSSGSRIEFREFYANSLGREIRYSILLPPSYETDSSRTYPVVYFLHGLFNDDTSWAVDRYGSLPPQIEQMMVEKRVPEFLMVHPQGQNSFYTDSADGTRPFEKYLGEDLIREIESNFRAKRDRKNRAIGGTSMGGFGALKLAMKHPDLFSSVLAGSPIVILGDDPTVYWSDQSNRFSQHLAGLFAGVFGDPFDREHWKRNSLENLARTSNLGDMRILMIYGTADRYNERIPIEKGVRALEEILSNRGVDAELKIYEGEPHGWNLIEKHLDESILFLTETFGKN